MENRMNLWNLEDSYLFKPFDFKFFLEDFFSNEYKKFFKTNHCKDVDFIDKGKFYELNIEINVSSDNILIDVENNILKINYEETNKKSSIKGSFTITIPEDAEISTMIANFGVINDKTLSVRVDKKKVEEANKNIKINIK